MMTNLVAEFQRTKAELLKCFLEHVQICFVSVMVGIIIAVPLGIILTRYPKVAQKVLAVMGVLQTIPSMVMFGVLIPFMGIGKPTAMVVLCVYSILPILRNTYTGVSEVPDNYIEAAKGMGMSSPQILFKVELPIALPVIVTGIRLSSVYIISWATVAALIGGGGLGDLIYTGMNRWNHAQILLGAIPASLLAIVTSFVIGAIAKAVTPKGMRR